jgi:hypothetical protein
VRVGPVDEVAGHDDEVGVFGLHGGPPGLELFGADVAAFAVGRGAGVADDDEAGGGGAQGEDQGQIGRAHV